MATYFWVGGTGTWSATGNTQFAITSGGVPTLLNPIAGDIVNFDSNSGTGTCTTAAGAVTTQCILNSATLGLILGANFTISNAFTLTSGSLSLGSSTLSCRNFLTNSADVRTIDFGTGNITLTGSAMTIWTSPTSTNLTALGSRTVNCTYAGSTGTRTISTSSAAGTESAQVNFYVTAGSDTLTVGSGCRTLDLTGFAGTLTNSARVVYGNLVISSGVTLTAGNNTTTFAATSGTQQITTNNKTLDFPITQNGVGGTVQLQDNLTMGSTRSFTLTNGALDLNNLVLSTGFFASSNSNIRSIAFGTGKMVVTGNAASIFVMTVFTNCTITGTGLVEATYSGSTGTRRLDFGAGGESNAITLKVTAGSDIISLRTTNSAYKDLDFTGFSGSASLGNSIYIYGNLITSSGMTWSSSTASITFGATSGAKTITTANKTLDFPIVFNGSGGTFVFQDSLTQGSTRLFTIANGTIKLKENTTNTVGSLITLLSNVKYLQTATAGTQAIISQASGTISPNYLNVKDISAQGGAVWNAYTVNNNVDAGNNYGWNFGGKFMPMFG